MSGDAMHDIPPLVVDLAIALGTAAVITVLFRWLKLPVIFGYLLAGMAVGPNVPLPMMANAENVHVMSELGIILIMFGIGLEFSMRKVVRSGPTALLMAALQAGFVIMSGLALGRVLGWSTPEAIFMGCAMVATSTVVIVKLFESMRPSAALKEIVFAVTILHDLFAIIIMTILVTITKVGVKGLQPTDLAWTIVKFVLFLVGVIFIGRLFVPKFLRKLADHERGENLVIASMGFCFCAAILAVASGFSLAIGAFAAGMLAAESGRSKVIEKLMMPIRDVFTSMFFVAAGMMLVPAAIVNNIGVILLFVLLVILANALALTLAGLFAGQTFRTSFQTGIALGQFGEFAFIMMGIGIGAGMVRPELFTITVSVSVITALTSSVLFKHSGRISDAIESRMPEGVRASLALYQVWASSLRSRGLKKGEGQSFVKPVVFLFLDGSAIVGLVAAHRYASDFISHHLEDVAAFGHIAAQVLLAALLGLGIVFMVASVAKQSRNLARLLAAMAPNPEATGKGRGGRHILAGGLVVAIMAAVWLPLMAVLQTFVPATPLFLISFTAFIAVVIVQIYRIRQMSQEVSIGTEWLLSRLIEDKGEMTEVDMNRTGALHVLRLGDVCPSIGRHLSALDLAGRASVTVVALLREDHSTVPLHPSPLLMSNDRLVLVGSEHSLVMAKGILFGTRH
jgi:CPA2 family monovalent cation:H+ antiporter-2